MFLVELEDGSTAAIKFDRDGLYKIEERGITGNINTIINKSDVEWHGYLTNSDGPNVLFILV